MAHGNVHVIKSKSEWDQKLAEAASTNKVVVVDFTATWCGPCKFIAPVFAELSEKYSNIVFLKVDVDEHNDICTQFEVRAMPTFVFIIRGNVADRIVGANKVELEKKIKTYHEKGVDAVALA